MGMVLWRQAGFESVMISGRRSKMVKRRAKEMRVTQVFQSVSDKEKIYLEILQNMGKSDEEVCFIGDDLVDIPLFRRVGLAVAVPNAVPEVKGSAHYITEHTGGNGAVREVIDLLLKANGKWKKATRES
jgi:3-deoxy-D-manno-octulosonate 8-phosphate phosphatase (KDO 8-P phosphatase)